MNLYSVCRVIFVFCLLALSGFMQAGISTFPTYQAASFDDLATHAFNLSQKLYSPVKLVPIIELDRPLSGILEDIGLVFDEYSAIIDKKSDGTTNNNFLDDHIWWAKACPRGEVHKDPINLFVNTSDTHSHYNYISVPYILENYNYSSPKVIPPLKNPISIDGQYLSAIEIGRKYDENGGNFSWPQILYMGGEGYWKPAAFSALQLGSSIRSGIIDIGSSVEKFPKITEIYVSVSSPYVLNIRGIIDSPAFTEAFSADMSVGSLNVTTVQTKIFIRGEYSCPAGNCSHVIGPIGVSSMFWKGVNDTTHNNNNDQAHDADTIRVAYLNGISVEESINNPLAGSVTKDYGNCSEIDWFSLAQMDREEDHYSFYSSAQYHARPNILINITKSSIPCVVKLYSFNTDSESLDNIVSYVSFSGPLSIPKTDQDAIRFDYEVTADDSKFSFANVTAIITHFYRSILGRDPDPSGLSYYQRIIAKVHAIGDVKPEFRQMAYNFFNSPEYLNRNASDTEYVTTLYKTFLQRDPDSPGLYFYMDLLRRGVSRNSLIDNFVNSPEFDNFMKNLGF